MLTECNPAFATMVGVGALAGRALRDILAAADADALGAWLDRALSSPEPPPPIEVFAGAGRETVLSLVCGRIDGAGEAALGLILHALNLSETKKLETRFLQAQKMEVVGKLAGGIEHDFNNLLTAMIGFCDLVLLRHNPKDQSYADIMQIKQNANRAASLVRQLLAFSRQQTLQPRVINVTDVLAELSHLLRRLIGANIELRLIHGRDLGLVKVDQSQFEQVIINLAVNARDVMAEGGTLTIRTSNLATGDAKLAAHGIDLGRDFVVIEAIDTGHGIAKEHLPKIFEPFFTTKDVGQGTGLGLSTVYGIIEQTGGHVLIDSSPGEGANFTILLPRHQTSGAAEAAPTETKDADARRDLTGTGTVLLVEDEDAVRLFGARALRNKGYQVIEAKNGEAALEVLSQGKQAIDILVTDVVMPGMDGPMLVRHVREKFPDLKVVFMSGYTEDSFRQRLDKDMAIHFLPKPFSLQQLAARVKEVLQGKPT